MSLTLTDMFCGAGGSSTGLQLVPGITVKTAMNHWARAIETHNTNHPEVDHVCADIQKIEPDYVPSTDILWASPECTNHSVAKGKKRVTNQGSLFGDKGPDEAAIKSRATMWDVPRFAEIHDYKLIITENVVDAARWVMFDAWLHAMDSLGYDHHIVYMNSMHAQLGGLPAPQSRDRMYVMFWKKGNQEPDFDRLRPLAYCPSCDETVRALQVFLAFAALNRHQQPAGVSSSSGSGEAPNPGLLAMPDAYLMQNNSVAGNPGYLTTPVSEVMRTLTTTGHQSLLMPYYGSSKPQAVTEPIGTLTTVDRYAMITLRGQNAPKDVYDPMDTFAANGNHHGLMGVRPPEVEDCTFRMLEPHEVTWGMAFPREYIMTGTKREMVKQAGNAVCPPNARDLGIIGAESLGVAA